MGPSPALDGKVKQWVGWMGRSGTCLEAIAGVPMGRFGEGNPLTKFKAWLPTTGQRQLNQTDRGHLTDQGSPCTKFQSPLSRAF
ncbi:MAG: hypothetical protein ACKO21_02230 [Nodosilinea sp.]